MLTIESFPHYSAHHVNDHRQAALVMYLLAFFVLAVALFALGMR